jgi:D-cysteine desulfhydrase
MLPSRPMSGITIQWKTETAMDQSRLVSLLGEFGELLFIPLGSNVNLESCVSNLIMHADVACAVMDGETVGFLAMYPDDQETQCAHISVIAVKPKQQGRGIGKAMLSRALGLARQWGMKTVGLDVSADNKAAQQLCRSLGFHVHVRDGARWQMRHRLSEMPTRSTVTPMEEQPRLLAALDLDIELRIKRDDLYPMAGGGIKARKIEYIARDMIAHGQDVIVTNGGPQSNHARASAIVAAILGIKCHLVIVLEHGARYLDTGNILLMRLSGAEIEYCTKDQLATRMDCAMDTYRSKGHNPRYVWGGGHCLAGTVAFVDAALEAQEQCGDWIPDFLVTASATGSTQAGFAIGYARTPTRVIGISAARDKVRGSQIVRDCVSEYADHVLPVSGRVDIDFRDDWTEGGYERTSPQLLELIQGAARAGVFVDPTYSGKALNGLVNLVMRGEIPSGSKVLFWHTGGLMNLQASAFAGGMICL